MKVYILGLDQSLASSITNLMDVLSMSNEIDTEEKNHRPRIKFDVQLASVDGKPVQCQHNTLLTPHCSFDDIKKPEMIILPAFMNIDSIMRKHKKLIKSGSMIAGQSSEVFVQAFFYWPKPVCWTESLQQLIIQQWITLKNYFPK